MPSYILPFRSDLSAFCAETVVADFSEQLPDLSNAVILVPEATARIRIQFLTLRKHLSDEARRRGYEALIPPTIATPKRLFSERYITTAKTTKGLCAGLSLATALHRYKNLFPNASRWQLADEIISVFDKISEYDYATEQADDSLEKNTETLAATWQDDTRILLTLWQTWKSLYDEKNYPTFAWYKMLNTDTYTEPDEHVYLCGMNHLSPCFEKWACNLYKQNRLTWISKANTAAIPVAYNPVLHTAEQLTAEVGESPAFTASDTDYSRLLDSIFSARVSSDPKSIPFAERAQRFAETSATSPFSERVRLFFPMTTEEHAWGIYIAVRRWLELKHQKIGLISLDRKLSRRIGAIFERYNIPLIDYSGWELSTTSSASALKHVLGNTEGVADIKTVLELMRSPYCDLEVEHSDAIASADYIEHLLGSRRIRHSPIDKALEQIKTVAVGNPLSIILAEKIVAALIPIARLRDGAEHPYTDYFGCLFDAMNKLGMYKKLSADHAGERIISELQQLYRAVKIEGERASFGVWQSLILYHLEQSNFMPDCPEHGVFLMNPGQAELMQFDALAIVALDHSHFPHPPQTGGLINENIRRELGLETYEQSVGTQFMLFRTLLESAGHLLLSCQQYNQDRQMMPSAWLTAIRDFHKIAYDDLSDYELQSMAQRCSSLNLATEQGFEAQMQSIATPTAPKRLWPQRLSVGGYQRIIDCPYRFYARDILKIYSRREVSDYWDAMDYGNYLHRCLQELHAGLNARYDPPIWVAEKRFEISSFALEILREKFKESKFSNYVNYFWFTDANEAMTYYIDWMIERQREQAVSSTSTEQKLEEELSENLSMRGIADLILQTEKGSMLVDYKTGGLASNKDIKSGEHIQLTSYALLDKNINTAIYLALGAKNRGEQRTLQGEELAEYRNKNLGRLLSIKTDYDSEHPLNAWGNKQNVCKYCDYAGLCRRPAWDEYHDWATT